MRQQVMKPVFLPVVSISFVLAAAVLSAASSLKARAAVGEISIKQALALSSLNQEPAEEDKKLEMQNEDQIRKGKCCDRMQKGGDAQGWSPQEVHDFVNADFSAEEAGGKSKPAGSGASSNRGSSGSQ